MRSVSELLSRYAHLTPPDMVVRKMLATIIEEKTGFQILEKDIRISSYVAYCGTDSGFKNMLFLKKEEILRAVEEVFGKKMINDIR